MSYDFRGLEDIRDITRNRSRWHWACNNRLRSLVVPHTSVEISGSFLFALRSFCVFWQTDKKISVRCRLGKS